MRKLLLLVAVTAGCQQVPKITDQHKIEWLAASRKVEAMRAAWDAATADLASKEKSLITDCGAMVPKLDASGVPFCETKPEPPKKK